MEYPLAPAVHRPESDCLKIRSDRKIEQEEYMTPYLSRHLSRRVFRRLSDSKGNTLIEAAIVIPLLLLVTLAIVDFSALFYVHLALQNGVSQATRYGVTGNVITGKTRDYSIMAAMRDSTPTLTLDDSAFVFTHLTPGGSVWLGGSGAPGDIEKVTVNYNWQIITPLIRPFFTNGEINFSVESSMKNESKFQ
jgi:Flp pilus assembly protein TadG